jgi:hypothetical protein
MDGYVGRGEQQIAVARPASPLLLVQGEAESLPLLRDLEANCEMEGFRDFPHLTAKPMRGGQRLCETTKPAALCCGGSGGVCSETTKFRLALVVVTLVPPVSPNTAAARTLG